MVPALILGPSSEHIEVQLHVRIDAQRDMQL